MAVSGESEEQVMTEFGLLIGKLVEGASAPDVIHPATGRILTAAPRADQAQLDQAVAAAKTAFPAWSATPPRQRAAVLGKLADALEAEQGAFVRLLTQEQGKPLPQAMWEIDWAIDTIRYFATLDLGPDTPYAGAKQSGIGTELGREGLEEFTQATIINVAK